MNRAQEVWRNGSAALDLCYLACGLGWAIFWELNSAPWGRMSDFDGWEFSIWRDETLASNGYYTQADDQYSRRYQGAYGN